MADRVSNEKILKVITDFKTTGFQDALNALKSIEGEVNNLSNTFKQFSTDSSSVFKQLTQSLTNFTNPVKEQFSSLNDIVRKTMDEVKSKFDAFNKKSGIGKLKEAIQAMDVRGVGNSSLSKELSDLDNEVRVLYKDIEGKLTVAVTRLSKKVTDGKLSVEQKNKVMERYAYLLSRNVNPSLEGFGTRLTEIKQKILAATESTQKAGGVFEGFGKRMKIFLQYRAINFMVSSLRDLAGAAVELESSFANIQAITSASDTEMGKLKDTILRVGEASKYSVQEISNATTMLGQAGLSADEINNVLETTTQLAAGTGSELSNTVDLMTSALAVWGLNSEEASHLSDVMVTGMNRTKANLETFRMAVQYAGATMASLNVSFDEFASVAAAASNAGLRASVVGTGLRAMTSELISPTKKMVAGLAQLGLSTEDVNIESQGLVNVLYKLKSAGLTAANAYDLFGKRAAQFVLAAQGQLDVVDELRVAFNESGATLKAYGTQMDTISAQATALGNTLKEMAVNILDSISWMIKGALSGINKALQGIRWLFSDKDKLNFEEQKKELEDSKTAAKSFYDFIGQLSERDYGADTKKAIDDLNDVIDAVNEKFGKNINYVKDVNDLADAYKRVKDEVKKIGELEVSALNTNRKEYAQRLIGIAQNNYFEMGRISNKYGTDIGEDYRNAIPEYFEKLSKNEGDINKIRRELKEVEDDALREALLSALDKAKEIFEKVGGIIKSDYSSDEFNAAAESLNNEVKLTNKSIYGENGYLTNFKNSIKEVQQGLKDSVEFSEKNIEEIINSANKIKEDIAELNSETIESITDRTLMLDELGIFDENERNEYIKSLKEAKQKQLDWFKSLLQQMLNVAENESNIDDNIIYNLKDHIREYTDISADIITQHTNFLKSRKDDKKSSRSSSYRAGDSVRDAAKKFNERYAQAESQSQSLAYDIRKDQMERQGYQTRLSKLDTTGTLSKAYSRTSGKIADLEALKTAKQNAELLKTYKKDYGSLLEDVESNKVTLAEADKQSDGLISKMRELELSTTEATARFGDLDKADLSDIDSKIESLNDKLTKINESVDDPLKAGFQGFKVTIEEMADTYSAAGIGSMIAQDLGNGVSDALYSLSQGTKSMKDAFSDMARSILQDISKMLIRMAVLKSMEAGLGFFSGGGNVQAPTQGQLMMGAEYASGGFIPKIRAALGTPVRGGTPGKDSVPAMLMPGEYVLKKSAVDALGTNFLNDLNNNAAQTLTNTSANLLQNSYEQKSESEPSVVNVWVVSKEEEAQIGPNDIIATIGKDIMTGGQTRRLIQSVVAGRK